ncbi:MAG: carboxypeptidase M32 [Fusobacteriaceae bacterium]|jgi:carboxypeptidase Taq|nr:carboxypeptidase M32 [Fusobacteriaceae bacterium]
MMKKKNNENENAIAREKEMEAADDSLLKEYGKAFHEILAEKHIIDSTITMLQWELETITPPGGQALLSKQMGYYSMKSYDLLTSEKMQKILACFKKNRDVLSPVLKREAELLTEDMERLRLIPPGEYKAYKEFLTESQPLWQKAKAAGDFSMFRDALKKIFDTSKRFARYEYEAKDEAYRKEKTLYDVNLEQYEKGMDVARLDEFFGALKEEVVPLLRQVLKRQGGKKAKNPNLTVDAQKKLCRYLSAYLGFDFERGTMAESEHPFTTHFDKNDVRFTTRYMKNPSTFSLLSTLHETGHAIYEQQIDDKYTGTILGNGSSNGLHEAQSRFYENVVGRSEAFWKGLQGREELEPLFSKTSLGSFCFAINKVEPSLIRIEADELTYPLHIMIRYEIEKGIFNDTIKVKDLPEVWNEKMREYLGITPPNDGAGVLQDVHWADGLIGYFPSYAIGSAYAAQIYASLRKDLPFEKILEQGDLAPIREWLSAKIHRYGSFKDSRDIMKKATGEELNPKYYIEYLKERFLK